MTRRLTREDRELWERLRQSVKPLRPEPKEPAAPARAPTAEAGTKPVRAAGKQAAPAPRPAPAARPLGGLEERRRRRLARGLADIDLRIDLHGMRQERAFAALISFLRDSQARDARLVLVVTGKGGSGAEGRGVLKQVVPMWLSRPEFRDLVVGVSEAGRRHGGAGALYVQVRRRGRRSAVG